MLQEVLEGACVVELVRRRRMTKEQDNQEESDYSLEGA